MAQLTTQQSLHLALQQHQAGRLQEALQLYQQILDQQPDHAGALHYLGVLAHQEGRNDVAVDLIRKAIAINSNLPEPHNNLGLALQARGNFDEAISAYRQALALRPGYAKALYNLGIALQHKGYLEAAIDAYRRSIALCPDDVETLSNLGNALRENGQLEEAIAACGRAIALRPDSAQAHTRLGNVLNDQGFFDGAIAAHRRAIALDPKQPEAYNNLGIALKNQRQMDESVVAYRQAISLDPEYASAHTNLSMALLAQGDFKNGWEEHQWRWKCEVSPSKAPLIAQPQWKGGPLENQTVLLHAEQGFGDTLQFIRYLPLLVRRGANVIVKCQPELGRVFESIVDAQEIITSWQQLPPFDLHCPLLSLPALFKTTAQTIPADVPYLFPDPVLIESWRQKLTAPAPDLKVALAWAGNPSFKGDRTRSLTLDRLAPLANVPGATFYSIQKGDAQRQITNRLPSGLRLIDVSPDLHDFADTAAVMALMDLIITTDTSVAHLAGALGRPVWVMLQFVPDWRWMFDRSDSPWYPSMRLFRQSAWGDWDGVIKRIVEALSSRIREID